MPVFFVLSCIFVCLQLILRLQCYFFKNGVIAEKKVIDYLYNLCLELSKLHSEDIVEQNVYFAFFVYHI